ncbi:MAG: type II toxin-antitoxin system ParD family antitoxin [Ancalomicrobiaceae bacterium]|nr:type II toxin-antitoxin system ParD family antitoxin [Ancalomicrobiaceae bacterium]
MSNLNVSLPEELVSYVKTKVSTGRYTSSSEVIREALRLMEKQEQADGERLRLLQQAWREGIDSGNFQPLDMAAIKAEGRKRLMEED